MERMSVLLVDDDDEQRNVLAAMLEIEGYASTACGSALEALTLLEDGAQFALVISDVVMPGLDGVDFAARIRRLRPIPIVFMTGKASAVERIVANGQLALLKPFSGATLRAVLEECLGRPATAG